MKLYGIVYQILDKLNLPITEHNVITVTGLIHTYRQEVIDEARVLNESKVEESFDPHHFGYLDRYKE